MYTRPSDQRIEGIIGQMLRVGVILSTAFVLGGGVWYLIQYGRAMPEYGAFRSESEELRSVSGIMRGVLEMDARSLIQFGLLLLIATPVGRVMFSTFAFAAQRDRTYMAITVVVAAVLMYSLFGEH